MTINLGLKRNCIGCGAKFYDLGKNPAKCPKCATINDITIAHRKRARKVAATDLDDPLLKEKAKMEAKQAKAKGKKRIEEVDGVDLGEFEDLEDPITGDDIEEIEEEDDLVEIESLEELEEANEESLDDELEDAEMGDDTLIDDVEAFEEEEEEEEEEDERPSKAKKPVAKAPAKPAAKKKR